MWCGLEAECCGREESGYRLPNLYPLPPGNITTILLLSRYRPSGLPTLESNELHMMLLVVDPQIHRDNWRLSIFK